MELVTTYQDCNIELVALSPHELPVAPVDLTDPSCDLVSDARKSRWKERETENAQASLQLPLNQRTQKEVKITTNVCKLNFLSIG